MATVALSAVQQKIFDETALCVEQTKNGKFLNGFFYPRKKAEPECKAKANAKYASELEEAQTEAIYRDNTEYDLFTKQMSQGMDKKTIAIIGGVLLLMVVGILLID